VELVGVVDLLVEQNDVLVSLRLVIGDLVFIFLLKKVQFLLVSLLFLCEFSLKTLLILLVNLSQLLQLSLCLHLKSLQLRVTVLLSLLNFLLHLLNPLLQQHPLLLQLNLQITPAHHLPLLQVTLSLFELPTQLLTNLLGFLEIQFTLVL